jgi:hypothetical protein
MTTLRRSRRIHPKAWQLIKDGVDAGISAAQISKNIADELKNESDRPHPRHVQRLVKELTPGAAAPWSLADSRDADEARIILDTLRDLINRTEDRITSISLREADMVLKIRWLAPDLGFVPVWELAREYLRREDAEQDTRDLDAWLAFKPWTWGPARYHEYIDSGESELLKGVMRERWERWGMAFGAPTMREQEDATDK